MISSVMTKAVFVFCTIAALQLFAAEEIIPAAFKISTIGADKIQLVNVKDSSECEVSKKAFKEAGYQARFNEVVWVESDDQGKTTCNLIPLEIFKSFKGRLRKKFR